ncbi:MULTISPECIES: LLM class F420-dependent oxidoreductase [unclassified Nocardioides]|uniref:LLM class F420-dependent oxidoreductase n=1 Tax=unclassified Nocardioides TaxID=2615069 RepID=UPI001CEDB97C|nr:MULTISPECIES: LLM class F420-dependent oxidoreductase [unclassified Nocardioides]
MILSHTDDFEETADLLQDYEKAGLQLAAVGESYSFDAVSRLGFLAARTKTVEIASAILQVYSRTPALLAMTAAGLDHVSNGRFTLGIGASGPQVVEGFHGVPYDAPLGRSREVVEVCRKVWRREPLEHEGKHYRIPLPPEQGTGLGKPLKLINHPVRERIPISIAALGPANVALVAELAESWQPLFFHPQHAGTAWGEALDKGFAKRDPELGPLDIMLQLSFAVAEPTEEVLRPIREQLALYIGGMGARDKNFYNQLARRYGYDSEATEIQELYLAGRKQDAAKAVPDDLVRAVSLVGTEEDIADQVKEFAAAGVTTLLLKPLAVDPSRRVSDVATLSTILRR